PMLSLGRAGHLVASHRNEQLYQVSRRLEVILSQRGASEKTAEHRLADVARFEQPVESAIADLQPHFSADQWLVNADQFGSSLLVAGANAIDHRIECGLLKHLGVPPAGS